MNSSDDNELNYENALYPVCLVQNLYHLWCSSTLCDVLLVVDGKEISAHRAVLAAASPYFRTMFTSNFKESKETRVEMHEIEFSLLKKVVRFIYSSEIEFIDDNVYDLMAVADILQLSALQTACVRYLFKSLNTSNCLSILTAARMRSGYHDVAHAALRFARKNLHEVVLGEEYLAAPAHVLKTVFEGRVLNIPGEGFLLKAILQWINYNSIDRLNVLDCLSSTVHLPQISKTELDAVLQEPILENTNLQQQVEHTINTIMHACSDSDEETLWSMKTRKVLRFVDDEEVILALGGESHGMALGNVECLTFGYESWKCVIPTAVQRAPTACPDTKVIPTMNDHRCFFGVTYNDNKVFVAGGSMPKTPTASAEMYDIVRNEWTPLPSLPLPLTGVRLSLLDGQLVVSGGQSAVSAENRCWVLNEKLSVWKEHTAMYFPRSFHGLVSVDGSLYAIGGKTDDGMVLNSVERYEPMEDRWFKLAAMQEAKYDFGCACVDHYIYVMGGYDGSHWLRTVERYDTLTNQWSQMADMLMARASFGVTVCNSRVFCLGGYNGINYLNSVEKFNPRTNAWDCVNSMKYLRYGAGAATLRVPVIRNEESWKSSQRGSSSTHS